MSIIVKNDNQKFLDMKPGSVVKIIKNYNDEKCITIDSYVMRINQDDFEDSNNVGVTIMSPNESELETAWHGVNNCDYEIIKIV